MNGMSHDSAERLGYDLFELGFRPVPDIDDDGRLCGVRMFRARAGFLEYITLRPSGVATAGRVVAEFDYRRPFEHGTVLETRRGHVANVLRWLLSDVDTERTREIPAAVSEEVAEARRAATRSRRHTPPWEDPHQLMAGRSWESDRECASRPTWVEPEDELERTGRHHLTDTARRRLTAPEPEPDEDDTRPRPSPHPRLPGKG